MKKWWFLLLILGVIAGCSEESSNPLEAESENYVYPIEIGNLWEYESTLYYLNVSGDSAHIILADTVTSTIKVEITGTHLLPDSTECYVFQETAFFATDTVETVRYYRNENSGLYLYGFEKDVVFLPKLMPALVMSRSSKISALPGTATGVLDSMIFLSEPFKALQYPFQLGARWAHFRVPEMPYNADKMVTDKGRLTIPAGEFDAYEIQELIDINNDGNLDYNYEFYDYVSASGLVKRVIYFSDIEIRPQNNLNPFLPAIAVYDQVQILELKSVLLN